MLKRSALVATLILAGAGPAGAEKPAPDPLAGLMLGNARFVAGKTAARNLPARRQLLLKAQHPMATILSCSDSRVPPELLFDQGLGDIFVVRTAGNTVDKLALGSIEYGVEHLHTPLLMILGHQSCGAVKATFEAHGSHEGHIGEIIKKVMPAVKKVRAKSKAETPTTLDEAVRTNMRNVYAEILQSSPVVSTLLKQKRLKIVLAEYYLDSGRVQLLDAAP